MPATMKPFPQLTAGDLMSCPVVSLRQETPLREAARILLKSQISGAPVVDAQGKCVGMFSALDFVRLAEQRAGVMKPAAPSLPITCPFQTKQRTPDGKEVTLCTLAPGVCPIQVKQKGMDGTEMIVCSQPHCVLTDWQIVDVEKLPTDEVRQFMTADPVTVTSATAISVLARLMIDAHVHRIVVVDQQQKPIGVISSTDILAAVAYRVDNEHGGSSETATLPS